MLCAFSTLPHPKSTLHLGCQDVASTLIPLIVIETEFSKFLVWQDSENANRDSKISKCITCTIVKFNIGEYNIREVNKILRYSPNSLNLEIPFCPGTILKILFYCEFSEHVEKCIK